MDDREVPTRACTTEHERVARLASESHSVSFASSSGWQSGRHGKVAETQRECSTCETMAELAQKIDQPNGEAGLFPGPHTTETIRSIGRRLGCKVEIADNVAKAR